MSRSLKVPEGRNTVAHHGSGRESTQNEKESPGGVDTREAADEKYAGCPWGALQNECHPYASPLFLPLSTSATELNGASPNGSGPVSPKEDYEIHLYSQRVRRDVDLTRMHWHRIPRIPGPHLLNFLWWFAANHLWRWWDANFRGLRPDLVFTAGTNCWDADLNSIHIVFAEFVRMSEHELRFRKSPLAFAHAASSLALLPADYFSRAPHVHQSAHRPDSDRQENGGRFEAPLRHCRPASDCLYRPRPHDLQSRISYAPPRRSSRGNSAWRRILSRL